MHRCGRRLECCALAFASLAAVGNCAAADAVRVGKVQGVVSAILPADIGIKDGRLIATERMTASLSNLAGDAKVQQALTADRIDFGLGGPGMAFTAKRSPAIAVAALAGAPRDLCSYVGADSPFRTGADLKGKTVTVSTQGSLTDGMAMHLNGRGLGQGRRSPAGARGAAEAQSAGMRAHQIGAGLDGTAQRARGAEARSRPPVPQGLHSLDRGR